MKNVITFIITSILFCFLFSFSVNGQGGSSFIRNRCPNSTTYASVLVQNNGDINAVPCSGRQFLVNGSPVSGGATGTQNRFPYFTANNVLGNSPYGWNGTIYTWNNTALNSQYTMDFTPSNGAGQFQVGDYTTTPTYYFQTGAAGNSELASLEIAFGDIQNTSTGIRFDISDIAGGFTFENGVVRFPLGSAGTAIPSITTTTDLNTGFQFVGNNVIAAVSNGKNMLSFESTASNGFLSGDSLLHITWNNTVNGAFGGGADVGIQRTGVGVIKVSNGSTGFGRIALDNTTPSAATDACVAQSIWSDANFIYYCVASGNIKRAALSAF